MCFCFIIGRFESCLVLHSLASFTFFYGAQYGKGTQAAAVIYICNLLNVICKNLYHIQCNECAKRNKFKPMLFYNAYLDSYLIPFKEYNCTLYVKQWNTCFSKRRRHLMKDYHVYMGFVDLLTVFENKMINWVLIQFCMQI